MTHPTTGEIRPKSATNTQGNRPTAAQFIRAAELVTNAFPAADGNPLRVDARLADIAELIALALAEGAASIDQQPAALGLVPVGIDSEGGSHD